MLQTLKVISFSLHLKFLVLSNNSALEWVEAEDTYSLSAVNTLQDAVNTILKFLGLGPANLTENVEEGANTHTLLCSGIFRGGVEVLIRAKLALSEGVSMQLTVRTTDSNVAELVTSAIG